MTEKFEPLQKLREYSERDADANVTLFKYLMQKNGNKANHYYPLETFDFTAFMELIRVINRAFPTLSLNELAYLIYLYFWLEEQNAIAK